MSTTAVWALVKVREAGCKDMIDTGKGREHN